MLQLRGACRALARATVFSAAAAPALKGDKKADGPLWSLEGGLNNAELASDTASFYVTNTDGAKKKPGAGSKLPQWEDDEEDGGHKSAIHSSSKPKGGRRKKNAYQAKRGIVVEGDKVGFAGSVWLSSYYACPVALDGETFTSSAHAVMVTQALLFGDQERAAELRLAGDDARPHNAFDHKAPKNDKRKLRGFSMDVWNQWRGRLMFRATFAKFAQNASLKTRMLSVAAVSSSGGSKIFVEATSDPAWGCGILLSNAKWASEKSWTSDNIMGTLLTSVARLLAARENAQLTRDAWDRMDVKERTHACRTFVDESVALGARFSPPHFPGIEALRNADCDAIAASSSQEVLEDETMRYVCEGALGWRIA